MKSDKIQPHNTALIIIDMQNEFAHSSGQIYVPQAQEQIPLIKNLADYCRSRDVPVVYTEVIWEKDADIPLALKRGMPAKFQDNETILRNGQFGVQIHSDLTPKPEDYRSRKTYFDAFSSGNLSEVLNEIEREKGRTLDNLAFVGTTLNNCVYSTMLGAAHRGYNLLAIRDAISGFPGMDPSFFFNVQLPKFLGAKILTNTEFKEELEK